MNQSDKARTAPPGVWVSVGEGLPGVTEDVRFKDINGGEHIGRRSGCLPIWYTSRFEADALGILTMGAYSLQEPEVAAWTRVRPTLETKVATMAKLDLGYVFDAWLSSLDRGDDTKYNMYQAFVFGCRLFKQFKGMESELAEPVFDAWYTSITVEGGQEPAMRRAFEYAVSLYPQEEGDASATAPTKHKGTHDWVNCPICGESDMRRTTTQHGDSYIDCVNGSCASNGGLNDVAWEAKQVKAPAQEPVHAIMSAQFVTAGNTMSTLVELTLDALDEVHSARATTERVEGATLFMALGTLNEAVEVLKGYERKLRGAMHEFRANLRLASAVQAAVPHHAESAKNMELVATFLQMCVQRAGRQVSGDDLAASAKRMKERLGLK